jgi:uncharacterized membrane protein YoaK (UPF0700 family)
MSHQGVPQSENLTAMSGGLNIKDADVGRIPAHHDHLLVSLVILTFVTGVIDAVSVLGLGRVFTANMTCNVVFFAFALAGVSGFSAARSLTALVAFIGGAALGGKLAVMMIAQSRRKWLLTVAVIESALLFAAAGLSLIYDGEHLEPSSILYGAIVLTALAMELRNATVRKLGVPDMTTTVLTLTFTGLAADSSLAGGNNTRWGGGRRVASVVAMFGGAAFGALLVPFGLAYPLALAGSCVLATTVADSIRPHAEQVVGEAK